MIKAYRLGDIASGKFESKDKATYVKMMDELCCDEEKAFEYLYAAKFPKGFVCPHCGHTECYSVSRKRKGDRYSTEVESRPILECKHCHHQESIYNGTVMERSRLSPAVWFKAFRAFAACNTGVTANDLVTELGVCLKTARLMCRKIKTVMEEANNEIQLGECDIAELDCFMLGGKKHGKRGRGAANKVFVAALVGKNMVELPNGAYTEENVGVKFRIVHSENATELDRFLREVMYDPGEAARLAEIKGSGTAGKPDSYYMSLPCTTAIRADMSPANKKLKASKVWRMDLMDSETVKNTNYIQSLDHFISNAEANIRGSHHGMPRRCLVLELAEVEYNHRTHKMSRLNKFLQISKDMLTRTVHSSRWLINRFKQIQDNGFVVPEESILSYQNWDSTAKAAVAAY